MIKLYISLLFIIFFSSCFSQILEGDIVNDDRKMISNHSFIVEGPYNGFCIYEISVNRKGIVTSANLVETNIKSTPAKYEIRNYLTTMKFEVGTYYPKFHHALVKLTSVKSK